MALLRAMPETGLDPRWSGAIVALLDQPDAFLKMSAYDPLLALPADPRVIDPLLKGLGKNPAKASYVIDQIVQLLARVPEPRVLPYLAAALHASWPLYQTCFEAFRRAGDPAMAAEIRAWLEKHGDGPKGERTRLGNEVLAELEKKGPAPVSAATPAGEPKPAAPSKPKTLVFKKGPRPPKRERLEPIATQRKTLGEMFSEAGLAQHAEALIQPCLRLSSTRVELKALALGESRLGGLPDLPAGLAWPSVKKEPLTFVAQLDLAALERQLSKSPLPAKGQLAFFVSTDPDGEGGYLETAKVLFLAPGVKLVRRALPDGYEGPLFQACRLELVPMLKVPSSSHPRVTKRLKGEALSAYSDHVDLLQAPQHQVLGYRDHGYDSENPADAQLLFQCSSDPQADMTWGDVEELSFFIKEKDLAKGDFSKVWPYFGD